MIKFSVAICSTLLASRNYRVNGKIECVGDYERGISPKSKKNGIYRSAFSYKNKRKGNQIFHTDPNFRESRV